MIWQVEIRRGLGLLTLLALCGATFGDNRPLILLQPTSEAYYTWAIVAGGNLDVDKDTTIEGSLRGNADIDLQDGVSVSGDAVAVGDVDGAAAVAGIVTEGVAALPLPTFPPAAELEALADRVLDGDQAFESLRVDDVLLVRGKVEVEGALTGTGTLIVTEDLRLEKGPVAAPPEGELLSIIVAGKVDVDKEQQVQAVVRAGGDVKLDKDVRFEGVIVADGKVDVKKDGDIVFRSPLGLVDLISPILFIREPERHLTLLVGVTELVLYNATEADLVAAYRDDRDGDSGVDPGTFSLSVDGVLREDCVVGPEEARCPAVPLAAGEQHEFRVEIRDQAGNLALDVGTIDVIFDADAPTVTLLEPAGPSPIYNDEFMPVVFSFADVGTGVDRARFRVLLDGDDFSRFCRFPEGDTVTCQILGRFDGPQSLVVEVRDLAGNVGEARLDFEPVIDDRGPELAFVSPSTRAILEGEPIAVEVRFDDPIAGIEPGTLRIRFDGEDITAECTETPGAATCTLPAQPLGRHELSAFVEDRASNFMIDHFAFKVFEILPDFTRPSLDFTAPAELVVGERMPEIALAYADDGQGLDFATLAILLDGTDITASCTVGAAEARCPTPELVDGRHVLIAQITDNAGNRSWAQRNVTLTLDLPIAFTAPAPDFVTRTDRIDIEGTVAAEAETVTVAGQPAVVTGGSFAASDIALEEGVNLITAVTRNAGGGVGAATVRVLRDTGAPQVVIRTPSEAFVTAAGQIAVAGDVFDAGGADIAVTAPRVEVNGREVLVAAGSFFELLPLLPGENLVTVIATDTVGNRRTVQRRVERLVSPALVLEDIAGNGQTAGVGEPLAEPLVVRLIDRHGLPVRGRQVRFEVSRGSGSVGGTANAGRSYSVATDDHGLASASFLLGNRAGNGNHEVTARVAGVPGPVIFCASATPAAPMRVVPVAGANQLGALSAAIGTVAPFPLIAQVFDAHGNPIPGVAVDFDVVDGRGSFAGETVVSVVTDADGKAAVRYTMGPGAGTDNNILRASFEGLGELPANWLISGIKPGPEADTTISGLVLDNADQPIEGATIRVLRTALVAETDVAGRFLISGAPIGLVQLEVDGTTAQRPGTWPVLEFDFATISGHANNLGKPIHLLPIDTAGGREVGGTENVTIPVEGVAGAALTVFAGSATFPDGSRTGEVSVTQVSRDRVPMVAPRGGMFTAVVTIQPPGVRFDPPARLSLPNTEGLDIGSEVDLYSFDHDLGEFVGAGPMQVSDDGRQMVSVDGGGIAKSGWASPPVPVPPGNVCNPGTCNACGSGGLAPRFEVRDLAIAIRPTATPLVSPRHRRFALSRKAVGTDVELAPLAENIVLEAEVESNTSTTVTWDLGDGSSSEGLLVEHSYEAAGSYTVVARATANSECPAAVAAVTALVFVPESIRPVSLTFTNLAHNVLQDDTGEPYGTPHWVDRELLDGQPATTATDDNFPVTYVAGNTMEVEATFEISPSPPPALLPGLIVEGEGPGGLRFFGAEGLLRGSAVSFETASEVGLPNKIDKLSLPLLWRLSSDGGQSWLNAGRTESRVYVTLGKPQEQSRLFETVLDIGCREASGEDTTAGAIARIWSEFRSLNVERKDRDGFNKPDEVVMRYWLDQGDPNIPVVEKKCQSVEAMLSSEAIGGLQGIGTCTAWSELLIAVLRNQGIDGAERCEVVPDRAVHPDASGFLVRNWKFEKHIRVGFDGRLQSVPDPRDLAVCETGAGFAGTPCVGPGENGVLETVPDSSDRILDGVIVAGVDGICGTAVQTGLDDAQIRQPGEADPDARCVFPGPDGILDTLVHPNDIAVDGVLVGLPIGKSFQYILYSETGEDLGSPQGDMFDRPGVAAQSTPILLQRSEITLW